MKFNLDDFVQLDTKELLAVNGGGDCSASSTQSSSSGGSCSSSGRGPSGGSCSNGGGSRSRNNGGSCGCTTNKGTGSCSSSGKSGSNDNSNDSDNASKKTIITGEHTIEITQGDKVTDRSDGTIIVTHPDGSTDCYYENGQHTHYGAGENSSKPQDTGSDKADSDSTNSADNSIPNSTGSCGGTSTGGTGTGNSGSDGTNQTEGSGPGSTTTTNTPAGTNGGSGTGGTTTPIVPSSGNFGQITDGSYADELTMQIYKNNPYKYQALLDEKMNGSSNTFSHQGCKMTAAAKIASEVTGKDIDIFTEINNRWDSDKNGLLTDKEIANGLNNILDDTYGDAFDVQYETKKSISINDLKDITKKNQDTGITFVMAKVNLGDVNNDGKADEHWVVVEGYSQDSAGKITFTYDGTSDNDAGRTYILGGQPNPNSKIGTVIELQTFTINRK